MATTTNYGWTTPDDTALVKDGAAAIRTLGSSVDTTTKNLNPETTLGDIAYRSSTANVKTRLGLGTAGQVLAVNSGATAPEWKTIAAGGMTLISRQTISGSTGFSFSSIDQGYTDLKLRFTGLYAGDTSTRFVMRLNNDSGSNYHISSGLIYTGAANAQTVTNTFLGEGGFYLVSKNGAATGNSIDQTNGDLIIANYASTSLWKQFTGGWLWWNNATPQVFQSYMHGRYGSTSAITSIDFVRTEGSSTINTGTNGYVELWGLK
jgi:hypothetical protein